MRSSAWLIGSKSVESRVWLLTSCSLSAPGFSGAGAGNDFCWKICGLGLAGDGCLGKGVAGLTPTGTLAGLGPILGGYWCCPGTGGRGGGRWTNCWGPPTRGGGGRN